jgi:hypothetical protein
MRGDIMLPRLTEWDATKDALHRTADVLGKVRKAFSPRLPNALHLALLTRPWGLTTGALDFGGSVELHFSPPEVRVHVGQESHAIALATSSPARLREGIVRLLNLSGVDTDALPVIDDTRDFDLDPAQSAEYGRILYSISRGWMAVRADFLGAVTPMVVWPHGFDLSMLWFPGTTLDEKNDPHVNMGFSPGSSGLPRPYLYAYVWPVPEGLTGKALPSPARWHTDGWTGALIPLDELPDNHDLDATLREVFQVLSADMG